MSVERLQRRRLPLALAVAATLVAFVAILAVWADRQLLDNDGWTETSSALLENDAIREEVAGFLVDELYANVDVEEGIEQALPPRAAPLAGSLAGGLRGLADRGVDRLLGRPRVQQLWEDANRDAHAALIAAVEGGVDVVSTSDGDVVLDLKQLLEDAQQRIGVGGRAAQELPPEAARITILRSDQLELAQDAVDVFERFVVLLVLLAVALYVLAVWLASGRRRQALRACGAGLIAAGAAALVARSLAGDALVDELATTESVRPSVEATWTIATTLLEEAAAATIGYGLAITAAAWLAGPGRFAVRTRAALAPYLREPHVAYGGLGAVVLLVLAWGPSPATRRVAPMLFLIALLVVGMEALRRQIAGEREIGPDRP